MNAVQVWLDTVALHFMNRSQELRQMPLNAALFAEWGAGRTEVRPLDAPAADLRLDFFPIFRKFRFGEHDSTPSLHDVSVVAGSRVLPFHP
jgi:hypothetical protein